MIRFVKADGLYAKLRKEQERDELGRFGSGDGSSAAGDKGGVKTHRTVKIKPDMFTGNKVHGDDGEHIGTYHFTRDSRTVEGRIEINTSGTLYDSRDGKSYTLKDYATAKDAKAAVIRHYKEGGTRLSEHQPRWKGDKG